MPIKPALLAALAFMAAVPGLASAAAPAGAELPTPQFHRYGIAEGLPGNGTSVIAQDRTGYIWISTDSGLVQYDGKAFKVWHHRERDPASAPDGYQRTMLVDPQGRLWMGGDDGLSRYDPATGGFLHWRHDPHDPRSLGSDQVSSLAWDRQGRLWVATYDRGIDVMLADGRGFRHLRDDSKNPDDIAFHGANVLLGEADGSVWTGGVGLDRRLAGGGIRHIAFAQPDQAAPTVRVYSLLREHGALLIGTNQGLYRLDGEGAAQPVAPRELSSYAIASMSLDRRGRLWLGTLDGLVLRGADGHYRRYVASPLLPHALPGNMDTATLADREGGLWVGTNNGVAYLPPDWNDFSRFVHRPDDPGSLDADSYTAVAASTDGRLWIGGANGSLDRLDPATGAVEHVLGRLPGLSNAILALAEDRQGRLWISTYDHGYRLDRGKLDTFQELSGPQHIVFDDEDNAYLDLNNGGMGMVPRDGLRFRPLQLRQPAIDTRSPYKLQWYDHALWFATQAGLFRWVPGTPAALPVAGVGQAPLWAMDIHDGELWLASAENFWIYRWRDGTAHLLTRCALDGRHSFDDLLLLRADGRRRAWLFTHNSLWRLDPADCQLRAFGPWNGLVGANLTSDSLAQAGNGRWYVASSDGVIGVRPEAVDDRHRAPPVIIAALRVRRGKSSVALPPDAGELALRWNDRDLTITARALSYLAPEQTRYRFLLQDFDADWVETGTDGERVFSQLPGGRYTLRVQAAGADGAWGELPAPLAIRVAYPPWLRWWAWLGYAALLAASFAAILLVMRARQRQQHRVQLLAQENRLVRSANEAKTRFLAALGHEIRTPMTGVLGMAELLETRPLGPTEHGYVQAIRRSGEVLLTLVNDAIDLARIEAGRLELAIAPFDPATLLRDVADLQRGKAIGKGLSLWVAIDADVPAQVAGDAVRIKQILLNLLGNALKFTEQGEVSLRLSCAGPEGLAFTVADSGPGIAPSDQSRLFRRYEQVDGPQRSSGSGLGLAICRELVELMHGTIALESKPGQGSTFVVSLPLPAIDRPVPLRPAKEPAHGQGPWRLLLTEDDPVIAAVISGLLEEQGHAVRRAANGLHALQMLDTETFDAALIDLDLPGVDGFQLAGLIRRHARAARLPLVAVTARSGGDEETQVREAGMDGLLRKPLTGEQLARTLAGLLQ